LKVVFSRNAERDLEAIGDWIAQDNRSRDLRLRRRVHGDYLIFYDVGTTSVEILHVLHGARDYAQIIFPSEPD
jgi:plasmid stabilization system protein ParE